ncbi:MAG: hypothetical protein AAF787_17345, partial [Chloroflexota bacterium]
ENLIADANIFSGYIYSGVDDYVRYIDVEMYIPRYIYRLFYGMPERVGYTLPGYIAPTEYYIGFSVVLSCPAGLQPHSYHGGISHPEPDLMQFGDPRLYPLSVFSELEC